MKSLLIVLLVLAACRNDRAASASGSNELNGAARDTVDVLQAVWRAATAVSAGSRTTRLYLPASDTSALTASEQVRTALVSRGVPALSRLEAGYDTVVFRAHRWTSDSTGAALVEMRSVVTTVLGSGSNRCRQTSGTVASYRAVRTSSGWSARIAGPVEVGDGVCRPL